MEAEQLPVTADMGKGGKEHRYLQQLLAQWAQALGYRATIEVPTPEEAGHVRDLGDEYGGAGDGKFAEMPGGRGLRKSC